MQSDERVLLESETGGDTADKAIAVVRDNPEMIAGTIYDAFRELEFNVPGRCGRRIGSRHRMELAMNGDAHRPGAERCHERAPPFAWHDLHRRHRAGHRRLVPDP